MTFTLNTDSVLAEESFLTITGTGNNVEMKNSKKGIELSNLTGACDFKSNDLQYNKDSETRLCFLPIANKVQIKKPMSKKLKVAGAIPYSKKVSKTVKNVHVLPVSKTSQAVSFNKVKKAKGYVIYRQKNGGEMEQAAVLKGNGSTVWIDKNIPAGELQTYAISSYKIKDGNKVYSQKSYLVSGVVSSDMKANATKVTLNKTGKVKLKKGKTLKLKAKVTGTKGKKLVSKKVRWYSKKKSVAIVTGDGKVTALKNGTCKIYAKAHNGKNSKVVVIKVA
ncbi:MAG: Ig-like domain-containing protein [Lachnospiraceae bacterium]|nr:Ig-like domain-containing protein [Lachnospiraceae bacterium]